jgi:hypothetical protein
MDLHNLSDRAYDRIFWGSVAVAIIGATLLYAWR